MKKIFKPALAGMVVVFLWGCVSNMALPWHAADFRVFKDDKFVARILQDQTQGDGFYLVPNPPMDPKDKAGHEEWGQRAAQGPYAFMSIRMGGVSWSMGKSIGLQLAYQFLVALFLAWLLSGMGKVSLGHAGMVCALVVLCGAFLENMRYWNWWSFPAATTLVNIADMFITWFLAGIAMAWVMKRKKA